MLSTTRLFLALCFATFVAFAATAQGLAPQVPGVNSVLAYGADPTGVADSTAAFNSAAGANATAGCVYVPRGTYKITGAVTLPASNGCIFGDGRTVSVLSVTSATFTGGAGVLVLPGNLGGNGDFVHDLGISFSQPDTSVRANLFAFPPGIYMQAHARAQIARVRISQAITCIDARGNSGGDHLSDIECGGLTYGLRMDGALDGTFVQAWHEWDFGINTSAGLTTIYSDGTNICFDLGRTDMIEVSGSQCFFANMNFTANAANSLDQSLFSNMSFDSGRWIQVAGDNLVSNVQFASAGVDADANFPTIALSGGHLKLEGYSLGGTKTVPEVQVTGGDLRMANGTLTAGTASQSAATVSAGTLTIRNSQMAPNTSAWTAPYVAQTGGFLQFVDNTFLIGGTGGAIGVSYALDNSATSLDQYAGNMAPGWALHLPAAVYTGVFEGFRFSAAGTPVHACDSNLVGRSAQVSDATAPTYGGTYTSGGAVQATVTCDGTNWITH